MAIHNAKNLTTARMQAKKFRKKGFKAVVFKNKMGKVRVSVTRK